MPLRGWGTWRRDNGLRGRSSPVRKPRNEKNNPINSPEFIEGTEVGDVEGHSLQGRRGRLRFRGSGRDGRRAFPQGVGARKGRTWDDGNPQGCNGKNAETDPRRKGGIGEMQGPGLRPGPLPADVPGNRPVTDPTGGPQNGGSQRRGVCAPPGIAVGNPPVARFGGDQDPFRRLEEIPRLIRKVFL